jgi:GWxTD domain-containing protein
VSLLNLKALSSLLLAFCLPMLALGQSNSNRTPDAKQRRVKAEPKTAFTGWPNQDVSLIITEAEKRAYSKLTTDEEREQFIAHFWSQRDPDPDTTENEYKDEYYERIAYANEHYSSGKAGWMSDRGRIYIKFGKPDEIESHPAGGSYERQLSEGTGSATTYPFERWFYRHLPGVGSGIEIEFVDPTGSGEYRLARDLTEKEITFTIGTAQDSLASRSYRREQYSPFAISELRMRLDQPPEFKGNSYGGSLVGSPSIDSNPLDFDIGVAFFRQSDDRAVVAFTIQTDNNELVFKDVGGLQTARLNIVGRILTVTQKRIGDFEDSVSTTATAVELTEAKGRKSAYAKAVVLPPGRYRLDVRVRDIGSGAEGVKHYGFQVPRFGGTKLTVSSVVLAAKLEELHNQPAFGQFVIGEHKVVPNLSRTYHRGDSVGVYMQVYSAGIDQTTLRPSVDVEYVLLKGGAAISKQTEDWRGNSDAGQRLILARLINSSRLMAGEYEVVIRIHDRVSGETLSPSAKFTVVE